MHRKSLLLFWLLLAGSFLQAQNLTSFVIASAGDHFQSSSGSLDWTLGETLTETMSNTSGSFSQGFHQPASNAVTGIDGSSEGNIWLTPNPVLNRVSVMNLTPGSYSVAIHNTQGAMMENSVQSLKGELQLNLAHLASGVYIMTISSDNKIYHLKFIHQ